MYVSIGIAVCTVRPYTVHIGTYVPMYLYIGIYAIYGYYPTYLQNIMYLLTSLGKKNHSSILILL